MEVNYIQSKTIIVILCFELNKMPGEIIMANN